MKYSRLAKITAIALVAALLGTSPPAYANDDSSETDAADNSTGLPSLAITQDTPEGTELATSDALQNLKTLDLESNLAVASIINADITRAINTVTWDRESDLLQFYVYGDAANLVPRIKEALPAGQEWQIINTSRSITELESTIERIARDPASLPKGVTFVSGTPSPDGASITIGVETNAEVALGSVSLPTELLDVPVSFVEESRPQVTTRFRTVAPIVAGGYTEGSTSAGDRACSSGYPVLRYADSQYNVITADHCTDQQGVNWRWGGNAAHIIGTSTFQAPGDTDLELYVGSASLSAYVFVGSNTDASTVLPIRGYVAPVGGNSVCYSGSRSGLVCSNILESSDSFNCPGPGFLQCYWTRWSTQASGIPASGNGDSGGPVFIPYTRTSDNTIGAYGIGIISQMANSSTSCTGDPSSSSRTCSANVSFAPLSRWTGSQSTHGLAYTTS